MKQFKSVKSLGRHCRTCGEILTISQNKFCCRECVLGSDENKKKINCMNPSRCRIPVEGKRIIPKGGDVE
jgi:hypothetical protein